MVQEAKTNVASYKEYAAQHQDAELVTAEDDQLEIDAVYYTQKNSTDAVYGTDTNTSLTRFNIDHEKLNTLQWNSAGNEIVYTFNVKENRKLQYCIPL